MLYETTLGVTSCTLFNWFAVYGIVPGLIILFGIIKLTSKLSNVFWGKALLFLIVFITTMSENYITNAAITMLFLSMIGENQPVLRKNFKISNYYRRSEIVK